MHRGAIEGAIEGAIKTAISHHVCGHGAPSFNILVLMIGGLGKMSVPRNFFEVLSA